MSAHSKINSTTPFPLLTSALVMSLMLPQPSQAASITLATSPLATSTTTSVKPNLVLVLDNSGSMDWDHMPDDANDGGSAVSFSYGFYGVRSSQCNEVYYDPAITYQTPAKPDGSSYLDSTFTGAWTNGFNTGSGTVNLDTSFRANQSGLGGNAGGTDSGESAYYYLYTGTQTTALQKNYNSTTNTFYNECHSAKGVAPGNAVFSKRRLATTETTTIVVSGSTSSNASVSGILVNGVQLMAGPSSPSTSTSTVASGIATQINAKTASTGFSATVSGSTVTITGPTSAANYTPAISASSGTLTYTTDVFPDTTPANLTNFANWYSFYRTRMLMMKTATGRAFSSLSQNYRVGLMKISSSTPVVNVSTFCDNTVTGCTATAANRTTWYNALYNITTSGSTPLRTALSNAGRYFAGQLGGTDPIQYSCQQNFAILSTDGYWNSGDGYMMDGSTVMDNQDGTVGRPMFDGAQTTTTWTWTYTRNSYSKVTSNCTNNRKKLQTQPQIGTCTTSTSTGSCTPTNWIANGPATISGTCLSSSSIIYPGPPTGSATSTPAPQGGGVQTAGTSGGSSNSLADVAMYYWNGDLRTTNCTGALGAGTDVCFNNVFTSSTDNNTKQHMTTFTLGLGASGWMNYSSSYLSDTTGDYVAVKLGSTADSTANPPVCSWQVDGTVCNWPLPGMDSNSNGFIANVDDLWHAAVDGHGAYFSATNPTTLAAGLSNALSSINAKRGSAAAAATSTLNPVSGNNYAYVASYTTVTWKGNLEARGINVDSGVVSVNATWCAENVPADTCAAPGSIVADTSGATTIYNCVTPNSVVCTGGTLVGSDCQVPVATTCTGTMGALVSDASDTRSIFTAPSGGLAPISGRNLVPFDATYATANPTYFSSTHISSLSQWSLLTSAQRTAATGTNLVNFLRGQYGHEDRTTVAAADRLYRYREAVLGDALESQPSFISSPVFSYPYPGYSAYKTAQAGRSGTVYMGANDGMMHAFNASTGVERWAYVPSMVIPKLWILADSNYATLHQNFVNGSPITSDVCTANCTDEATAVWKTILVAGLNGGGRGYYALDITNPDSPALLWEFTTPSGIGTHTDPDLGYSFGQPIITQKNDGTWVVLVTSGYNNAPSSPWIASHNYAAGDQYTYGSTDYTVVSAYASGTAFGAADTSHTTSTPSTSSGNGQGYLYVLNAGTGAIISKIGTGVGSQDTPSGLAKIAGWNNETSGNRVGYVYGGDLQGNLWRFDINGTTTAAIGTGDVLRFATLFSDTAGNNPQPITTTPILALANNKHYVLISTGKYLETSDLTTTQKQTLYSIRDDNATATFVNPRNTLPSQTLYANPDGTATRLSTNNAVPAGGPGCFADYPDTGERANIDSQLVQGILIAPSIVPSNTACSPGGYGWLNYFNYTTCGATSARSDSTIVGVNVIYVQGNPIVEIVTSTNPTPTIPDLQPPFRPTVGTFSSKRSIWHELTP